MTEATVWFRTKARPQKADLPDPSLVKLFAEYVEGSGQAMITVPTVGGGKFTVNFEQVMIVEWGKPEPGTFKKDGELWLEPWDSPKKIQFHDTRGVHQVLDRFLRNLSDKQNSCLSYQHAEKYFIAIDLKDLLSFKLD